MRKQNTNSNLSDICTLSTHVWSGDYLKVWFVPHHSAIIVDASRWVLYVDKGMFAFD